MATTPRPHLTAVPPCPPLSSISGTIMHPSRKNPHQAPPTWPQTPLPPTGSGVPPTINISECTTTIPTRMFNRMVRQLVTRMVVQQVTTVTNLPMELILPSMEIITCMEQPRVPWSKNRREVPSQACRDLRIGTRLEMKSRSTRQHYSTSDL